jgi:3-dehydroquinate dehydratase-2
LFVIDVINGPNLNLLGTRRPEIYGSMTLEQIEEGLKNLSLELGVEVRCFQSNHEGEIIELIHQAGVEADFIIINAGAYTHTSVVIRDALEAVGTPAIEVHLSNTQAREDFRRRSLLAGVTAGRIEGLGALGYHLALRYAAATLGKERVQ